MGHDNGGIDRHLGETYDAVTEWLENTAPSVQTQDDDLAELLRQDAKPPEQPEVISLLYASREFGVPVYAGDLMSWPFLLKQELIVAQNAQKDYETRRYLNAQKANNNDNQAL